MPVTVPVTDRPRRRPRRSLALAAALVVLAAPALASCGFDYATDRVNTIAPGTNDRSGDVKVLGAVVIADQAGSGVFAATLANGGTESDSLDNLTGETADGGTLQVAGEVSAVEIPAGGRANLVADGGIPVSGEFEVGDFVTVTLTFGNGETAALETNVVRPCYQYSPDKLGELNFPESTGESTDDSTEDGTEEGEETGPDAYSCETLESDVWRSGEEPHHGGDTE